MLIFIGLLVALIIWFISGYNRLVQLNQRIKNAWTQIDIQLKRRHDLIPNLVEIVKGYMSHEKQTLENVIKARSQATEAKTLGDKIGAENFLTSTLRSLFALVESYPDLKANQNVLKLQEELTTTENRISFSRQFYNDEVMSYNTVIKSIPTNIIAGIANFKPEPLFELKDSPDREEPKIKF